MTNHVLRTLIVDDEPLAIEGLKIRLSEFDSIDLVGTSSSAEEAKRQVANLKPDLIFQDYEMTGITGIEFIKLLPAEDRPLVIFVTAHKEYAIDAFNVDAVDYILKPATQKRIDRAIAKALKQFTDERVIERRRSVQEKLLYALHSVSGVELEKLEAWIEEDGPLPSRYPDKIAIKDCKGVTKFIPVKEIEWVDAAGDYMCLHQAGETHILRITLKKLQKLLSPVLFTRIHKSTIVNTSFIDEIVPLKNSEAIVVIGGAELKVSRHYSETVRKLKSAQAE